MCTYAMLVEVSMEANRNKEVSSLHGVLTKQRLACDIFWMLQELASFIQGLLYIHAIHVYRVYQLMI